MVMSVVVAGGSLRPIVEGREVSCLGRLLKLGGQAREEARLRGIRRLFSSLLQLCGGVACDFRKLGRIGRLELTELLKQLGKLGEVHGIG
jgi:hypothetical protein